MQTLAVAMQKGGVGKTTTAVHLAAGLALKKKRVLLVDLDPQGNSSAWLLGLDRAEGTRKGAAEAMFEDEITEEHLAETPRANLTLMPATPALSSLDHYLAGEHQGQLRLRAVLMRVAPAFDYCILDCPPNMGLTVLNALCAADGVVGPVAGAFLALAGMRQLSQTVDMVRTKLELPTRLLGYVLFAADPRESITDEARKTIKRQAKDLLFKAEVRVSTAAKVLPSHQETAWDEAAGDERGAEDYKALLQEVLFKLGPAQAGKRVA